MALGVGITAAVPYSPQPEMRIFGTVETRCGDATGLEFPECTDEVRQYFSDAPQDARARELLGKRPPTGNEWYFLCGSPQLIRGAPAILEPAG
jgi:hypothetical protein